MFAPVGMDPGIFAYVVLPLLIFFARIGDMSLDTIRIIYVMKGYRFISTVLGFIEVMIWLVAISQVLDNLTNVFYYIAYAGGFAAGNLVGMILEERLSIGKVSVKVVVRKNASKIIASVEKLGHLMTITDAYGEDGDVKILYMVMQRKDVTPVIEIIRKFNPTAFYWVEDVRFANDEDPIMKRAVKKSKHSRISVRR